MRTTLWRIACALALAGGASVVFATSAFSQTPSTGGPFAGLHRGQSVWITLADGREVAGRIVNVNADRVGISSGDHVTDVSATGVRRVETPDPIRDGAIKGALYGAAAFAWTIVIAVVYADEGGPAAALGMTAIGAGAGAGLGAYIDHARQRRTVVFTASPAGKVAIAPLVGPGAVGATARIRW